jgi:hypothetical protein
MIHAPSPSTQNQLVQTTSSHTQLRNEIDDVGLLLSKAAGF